MVFGNVTCEGLFLLGDAVAGELAEDGTCTNGMIRPLEFLTNVAGTMRPLGSITGMVLSGSSVW